ncbi:MAG: toxin-antitoxin system HicB family antitoxin [Gaiellaceae bacterium]
MATRVRREDASHSGRLLLRMPQTLHAELARSAEAEGVSLNQFITSALASAVGWRHADEGAKTAAPPNGGDGSAAPVESSESSPSRAKLITLALAANFVVVAATAVVAIGLLIVAWRKGW